MPFFRQAAGHEQQLFVDAFADEALGQAAFKPFLVIPASDEDFIRGEAGGHQRLPTFLEGHSVPSRFYG